MSETPRPSTPEEGEEIIESRVKALDYAGGESGYCELLVVMDGSREAYVLHHAFIDYGSESGVRHGRVIFSSREDLEGIFDELGLAAYDNLNWEETDRSLGFNIPPEEFDGATAAITQSKEGR